MDIDENRFFREATLRICGSLDAEIFLFESFKYICKYIPADKVYLTHYRAEKGSQLALASASHEGGRIMNEYVPASDETRKFFKQRGRFLFIVDRAVELPPSVPWIERGLLKEDSSMLAMRLIVDENMVGGITFVNDQSGAFNQKHADLIALIREPLATAFSNSLRYNELNEMKELLADDNLFLRDELRQSAENEIIGSDFGLRGVMELVRQVAPLTSPVILLGETGTGKELIAAAIHQLSHRKDGPFIKVNCGAIPDNLIDSELFGHEKGAFTGAISLKKGRFERSNGGTIFLDEIGELKPDAQVRLLRVLQEKEIERVGGTESINVDIRIIAATNRNLDEMVTNREFREDLYFRLKVFPIPMPPLRERRGDISSLVQHFMVKKSREMGLQNIPAIAHGAFERLQKYNWPGNVRELENMVERALILNKGEPVNFEALTPSKSDDTAVKDSSPQSDIDHHEGSLVLNDVISSHIRKVLNMAGEQVGGNGGAAEILQINPSTLRKKMNKLGIKYGRKSLKK